MSSALIHKDTKIERKEMKYYIPYIQYIALSSLLSKAMKHDRYNVPMKGYLVRSLYFDTLDNKSFEEKMAGLEEKTKYRLRIYGLNDKAVKFEIKKKFNDMIVKESALISREDAKQVQNKNYEVLLKYKDPILNKIYKEFKKCLYQPVLLVDYWREAYVWDFNNIRIVFDRFLKSSSLQLDVFNKDVFATRKIKKCMVIMEIKYNNFIPDFIKNMMQIPNFTRSAISKYAIGRLDYYETMI